MNFQTHCDSISIFIPILRRITERLFYCAMGVVPNSESVKSESKDSISLGGDWWTEKD